LASIQIRIRNFRSIRIQIQAFPQPIIVFIKIGSQIAIENLIKDFHGQAKA